MTQCYMKQEIEAEPQILRERASAWSQRVARLNETVAPRANLVLIGRGSSGNACTFASYLYGLQTGRHAIEFRPWVATHPAPDARWDDARVFAYSVSGESTDVAHAALWLRTHGAQVIGITNARDQHCHLGGASDQLLHLDVGEERAVPSTKTFTAQLFASAALCGFELAEPAAQTAAAMEFVLQEQLGARMADFLVGARRIVFISRGPALAAALDCALKVQECAGIPGSAWSAAEFLHGPIAAIGEDDRVVLLADTAPPAVSLQAVGTHLLTRNAPFLVVRPAADDPSAGEGIEVPLPNERWACTPVLALLGHSAALELAQRRGINPDAPLGLNKVTLT